MAAFLYRVGLFAFRRRWFVVLLWLAVLGAAGFASAAASALPDDTKPMPGTEAQAALDLLRQRFGAGTGNLDRASAQIVFVAPAGENITDDRAVIDTLVDDVQRGSQVAGAVSPFQAGAVSRDGSTAYATVTYTARADDLADATRDQLRKAVDTARAEGLTVEVGGPVLASRPEVGGPSELIGVAFAALILLITFGSLVAAGLPLVTALLGVGIALLTIFALGGALGLSTTSSILAAMLGLAVGIDYALFVVSRYREERANGHQPGEAAGLAVGTAGSAVIFAGLTVIITLAGLAVVGIPIAAEMGLTAAGAVLIAILVALTVVPALLGFFPNAVLARRRTWTGNGGTRWARLVTRRPVPVLLASVAGLMLLAVPILHLRLGMPGDETKSTATTERRAYDALATSFGPGYTGPLTIVVDACGASEARAAVRAVAAKIAGTPGVVAVSPAQFNPAGDTALITAIPATAPTSEQTKDLVQRLRAGRPATESGTGAIFLVTGVTALNIDLAQKVPGALVPYLTLVLGLAFLLLLLVFRSPVVPLEAVFGFLLSTLAALGTVVAVFQWGWGAELIGLRQTGPIISTMPIMLVGMIFGLAMDYEVFFVSRMREAHTRGEPARQAVHTGFRHSARIVVAAALIMTAVFSGFIGADLPMIKMIGFSLATAVLLDAFVVRMTLVPALLTLTGELAWSLPRWLDRLLPRVDVEGAALRRDIADHGLEAARSRSTR